MVRCNKCREEAAADAPQLCRKHFMDYVEDTIHNTIASRCLFSRDDRIGVGCAGGKDSTVLLSVLMKLGYKVTALAVDEGIAGYRDASLASLKEYCASNRLPLKTLSFAEVSGITLDAHAAVKKPACTGCGKMRRHLLNRLGHGFDAVAVGHNLDDEAQGILMNLLRNQIAKLSATGPVAGITEVAGFVRRVKPLYFVTEKQVMAYAVLIGLPVSFDECPYARYSYRAQVRDALNDLEAVQAGAKRRIVEWFMRVKPKLMEAMKKEAGAPISADQVSEFLRASGVNA